MSAVLKKVGLPSLAFYLSWLLGIYATTTSMFCRRTCEAMGEASRNYFASVQDSNNYFLTSDPPGKLFPIMRMEGV